MLINSATQTVHSRYKLFCQISTLFISFSTSERKWPIKFPFNFIDGLADCNNYCSLSKCIYSVGSK